MLSQKFESLLDDKILQRVEDAGGKSGATWLATVIHSASNSIGVFVSFFLKEFASIYSSAAMGSDILIKTITTSILDPITTKLGVPSLSNNPVATTALQAMLISYAVANQLAGKVGDHVMFTPFLAFEALVTNAFFGGVGAEAVKQAPHHRK
jgi:hypothetical protein